MLAQLARVARLRGAGEARDVAALHNLDVTRDGVWVTVVARDARPASLALVRRAVQAAGGEVLAAYHEFASARVPLAGLRQVAASRGVLDVRRPEAEDPAETVSEGLVEMGAESWVAAGFDGRGVKIGIIDGGFKGYQALLGAELPATVVTWGKSAYGPEGGPDDADSHGTSVAEIVHDIAPGAQLYLAKTKGVAEFGLAAQWMAAQGVRVINYSMAWRGWGNDGTGPVNAVVTRAVAHDIFWANGAGNYRRMHWMGDFLDPDGDSWLDWDGVAGHWANTCVRREGGRLDMHLWWDDSWTAAEQDYDLYLYQWDGAAGEWTPLASSTDPQRGARGHEPVESIDVTAPAWTWYAWAVKRVTASRTDVDFDLLSATVYLDHPANPQPHYFAYERSIAQPADNPSAGMLAAAAVERPPAFAAADYSSQGPTRDGRLTPEISGPTDVASTSGAPAFGGTSAASPHVAGIAAILRQAYPSYSAAQIEELIKANAVDLGPAGPDMVYGWGRILLSAVPVDTTGPTTTAAAASVKKGKVARLRYRVDDAGFSAGPAEVSIHIKNAKGKVVKRLGPYADRPMCRPLTATFTCTLAKGAYRYYVKAVDKAGNAATKIGNAALRVT